MFGCIQIAINLSRTATVACFNVAWRGIFGNMAARGAFKQTHSTAHSMRCAFINIAYDGKRTTTIICSNCIEAKIKIIISFSQHLDQNPIKNWRYLINSRVNNHHYHYHHQYHYRLLSSTMAETFQHHKRYNSKKKNANVNEMKLYLMKNG